MSIVMIAPSGVAGASEPDGELVGPDTDDVKDAECDVARSAKYAARLLHMPVQESQAQSVVDWCPIISCSMLYLCYNNTCFFWFF